MKFYRGFPQRLHHTVPHWVEPGALFHIRIALNRKKEQKALIGSPLAQGILDSAKFYEARLRWHITLFLLMPDHLHALLSFPRDQSMSELIRGWKRFIREPITSSGRKDILTTGCETMSAAKSSQ